MQYYQHGLLADIKCSAFPFDDQSLYALQSSGPFCKKIIDRAVNCGVVALAEVYGSQVWDSLGASH
jgi:hypothetical protein